MNDRFNFSEIGLTHFSFFCHSTFQWNDTNCVGPKKVKIKDYCEMTSSKK